MKAKRSPKARRTIGEVAATSPTRTAQAGVRAPETGAIGRIRTLAAPLTCDGQPASGPVNFRRGVGAGGAGNGCASVGAAPAARPAAKTIRVSLDARMLAILSYAF